MGRAPTKLGWQSGRSTDLLCWLLRRKGITPLGLRLYTAMLRTIPELRIVHIGSQSLFVEPAALLVDCGNCQTFEDAVGVIEEVVLVSPRLCLITTPHTIEHWRNLLTKKLETDASGAITKLRYRQSQDGGRPFAVPEALPS